MIPTLTIVRPSRPDEQAPPPPAIEAAAFRPQPLRATRSVWREPGFYAAAPMLALLMAMMWGLRLVQALVRSSPPA